MDEAQAKRQNRLRLTIAALMGLLIIGMVFFMIPDMNRDLSWSRSGVKRDMRRIMAAIEAYRQKFHRLPRNLPELNRLPEPVVMVFPDGTIEEPFQYITDGSSYRLISYGADGKPGGYGYDADFENGRPTRRETLVDWLAASFQVLLLPSSWGMEGSALFSGLMTFVFCARMIKPESLRRDNWFALGTALLVTLVGAGFVALIITTLHVPSGH